MLLLLLKVTIAGIVLPLAAELFIDYYLYIKRGKAVKHGIGIALRIVSWVLVALYVSEAPFAVTVAYCLACHFLLFNTSLNKLRGMPSHYLSRMGLDNIFREVPILFVWQFALVIIATVFIVSPQYWGFHDVLIGLGGGYLFLGTILFGRFIWENIFKRVVK